MAGLLNCYTIIMAFKYEDYIFIREEERNVKNSTFAYKM